MKTSPRNAPTTAPPRDAPQHAVASIRGWLPRDSRLTESQDRRAPENLEVPLPRSSIGLRSMLSDQGDARGAISSRSLELQHVLDDFTDRWERGEVAGVEDYLGRFCSAQPLAIELVYREYCLAELSGLQPEPGDYFARFPSLRSRLERLLAIHRDCPPSRLESWIGGEPGEVPFPEAGDEIGPYLLRREIGRGSFARVFLAEQADLENRLVVVKLSTRPTREPWLLARARHVNIVEILTHAIVDDGAFQLISMPFLGGATLADVLRYRRQTLGRRRSRGELLKDLDAVAASEYESVNASHPARELLTSLNDPRAMAWIAARLAEALAHAAGRDVAHGDVKPSNVLLTANGTPMLLDFNLAQDWSLRESPGPISDPGGTLAYMAPERLRAIASAPTRAGSPSVEHAPTTTDKDPEAPLPHSADIYALGMVLLESLSGNLPPPAALDQEPGLRHRASLREVAAGYASFRERGSESVIRAAESASLGKVPPALRAILGRCLEADPGVRYRSARELSEDLDRWRTDRPLAYAQEPFWRYTLPRWSRRNRKVMAVAAMAVLAGVLAIIAMTSISRATSQAANKLSRMLDAPESWTSQLSRPGRDRLQDAEQNSLETAARVLGAYGVPGSKDWRQSDDFKLLDGPDREVLETWILEQALRYCHALESRPVSPAGLTQAIRLLDCVDTTPPLQAIETARRRLTARLKAGGEAEPLFRGMLHGPLDRNTRPIATRSGHPSPTSWLNHYLLGVVAEIDGDHDHAAQPERLSQAAIRDPRHDGLAPGVKGDDGPRRTGPRGPMEALEHYSHTIRLRPDSFWGHYRAAAICFRLGRWPEAIGHLDLCCRQRPENSVLRAQLASCLRSGGYMDEALEQVDKALELAPDHGEFYRSRAFIRAEQRRISGLSDDLEQFELLTGLFSRRFIGDSSIEALGGPRPGAAPASRRTLDLTGGYGLAGAGVDASVDFVDPDDIDARLVLAASIREAGAFEIAGWELDKVLTIDSNQIKARGMRMMLALERGHLDEARNELDRILEHAHLADFLRSDPRNLEFLMTSARDFAYRGLVVEALRFANELLSVCFELGVPRGPIHYTQAVIRSIAAESNREQISLAAMQLKYAFRANPRYIEWYRKHKVFDPLRKELDEILDQMPDLQFRS